MSKIHPMAAVDPKAQIAADVEIGPFCVIGPDVILGPGNRLVAHVTIVGKTTVGQGNLFYPQSVAGTDPQDKKFTGEETRLEIGDFNIVRECATIHTGTAKGGGVTKLGSHNLLMVNFHLGHDAMVGNHNVLSNNVMIAGHVHIGDYVTLAGGVGVHHFVSIGDYAYVAGLARVDHDVPPYCKIDHEENVRALNTIGLRRSGMAEEHIELLEDVIKRLFIDREMPLARAIKEIEAELLAEGAPLNGSSGHVRGLLEFLRRRNQGRFGRYLEGLRQR